MSKPIVNQEAVFELADHFVAQGKEPSIIALQHALGGSNTTVKRYLDDWRQARRESNEQIASLPPELAAKSESIIASLWVAANRLAQNELKLVKEQSVQALEIAEQRLTEVVEVLDDERAQLAASEKRVTEQGKQIHTLELRCAELAGAVTDKMNLAEEVDRLRVALNNAQIELAVERAKAEQQAVIAESQAKLRSRKG